MWQNWKGNILAFSLGLSLGVHAFFVYLAGQWKPQEQPTERVEIYPVMDVQLVPRDSLEVIDTHQREADEAPQEADFGSDRNLQAEEETSPEFAPSNIPQEGSAQEAQGDDLGLKEGERESFRLSEKDRTALEDPLLSASPPPGGQQASEGFDKRLKRGERLKVNAMSLDYGQYIIRMRERIQNRWNPKRTVRSEMYTYRSISVTVAVVLNDRGEVVDLKLDDSSFFNEFDDEAVNAFRQAAPFPNPPSSLIQDDGKIYMPWTFTLNLRDWGYASVK